MLTRMDWVDAATNVLVRKGIDSVKVDTLAKALQVTKGSFYWHFTDREDLLKQVLLHWQETQTELVITRYRRQGAQAEALVRGLIELPFRGQAAARGASVELAIRAWARRDQMARAIVDAVDRKRLSYMEDVFITIGHAVSDARHRAFLLYCYIQSEGLFRNQGTADEKAARRQFVAKLLLDAEP